MTFLSVGERKKGDLDKGSIIRVITEEYSRDSACVYLDEIIVQDNYRGSGARQEMSSKRNVACANIAHLTVCALF